MANSPIFGSYGEELIKEDQIINEELHWSPEDEDFNKENPFGTLRLLNQQLTIKSLGSDLLPYQRGKPFLSNQNRHFPSPKHNHHQAVTSCLIKENIQILTQNYHPKPIKPTHKLFS
ncbi:hypothetical protein O181_124660 [Austropuccinia psidii MF-1]|uniref:Uncharacterized protein n=1 Tax=Austropuccinia psidii MF-1 TaxID=1389203 RepID=A0A9Q3Q5D3_9BASI|nr:hypothetical protein [Austropuccinia psidii MF-1]